MAVVVYKRKPDTCDAYRIELRRDELFEAAKWCGGQLDVGYTDVGDIDGGVTYVTLNGDRAYEGDYIVKYWNREGREDDPTFVVVKGNIFDAEYERA